MGDRWLVQLCVFCALAVTACGDNRIHKDGGTGDDAPTDVRIDARIDAPTDGGIDASGDGGIDAPMIDAPMIDAPMIDAPMIDAPMIDAPMIDAPMIDAPMIDAPMIDAPSCTSGMTPLFCGTACTDVYVDPLNCGACGINCGTGSCMAGVCCAAGQVNCSGTCSDFQSDEANCGGCGIACTTGQVCTSGTCQSDCTGATPDLCGSAPGFCTNNDTDENNCGTCGTQCAANQTCTSGVCLNDCGGATPNRCGAAPGVCVNFQTDDSACGNCTTTCDTDESCVGGACTCDAIKPDICNGTCTDFDSDPTNCGACGTACGVGLVCLGGTCAPNCQAPTPTNCGGACTDTLTDPNHCGSCPTACPSGGVCTNGACSCPAGTPTTCPAVGGNPPSCVNTNTDADNCGSCGNSCGIGQTCSNGSCCAQGLIGCNGQCVDPTTDANNCGGCGDVPTAGAHECINGQVCDNGTCDCGYGFSFCNGACVPTSSDPNNCGGCGNVPTAGDNICTNNDACVSNGCAATCPAPLTKCGNECVNLNTDSDKCGSNCGTAVACAPGFGCDDGACVAVVPVGADPAKCAGGGPPIFVPTGGGNTCTGNLGSVSFTFGLCSRTDIGPLSRSVTTDAFDSSVGPYVPGQKGGGIGVNGTINDTAKMQIGGDLWVAGPQGMNMKGDITVRQDLRVLEALAMAKLLTVEEDAYIGGPITAGGGASGTIIGDATSPALHTEMLCADVPNALTFAMCVTEPVTFAAPPCGTGADLIPVTEIVEHFAIPANNDNASIGLDPDVLRNSGGPKRLDLPCGYYHLNSISGSAPITIVAHGRTALFISGAIDTSNEFYLDLEPGSTLDVFVGGVMVSAQAVNIGNPSYPRLSRMYIGSPSCKGTGTCTQGTECCSGLCTNGNCVGANGLTNSLKLSGGGTYLNGVFYAGYGDIRFSNPLEMYGALFANYFDASGETVIHYDEGVVNNGEECPPLTGSCDTCRDCDNQACNGGTCGACTADADCCAPLSCVAGVCKL